MFEKKKYQLYASKCLDVPHGIKYSFVPSHLGCLFVYSDTEPIGKAEFKLIPENTPLSSEVQAWLSRTKMAIDVKVMRENQKEYANFLNSFLDNVEKELKQQANKQKSESDE